jgi:hypothetical protein
MCSCLPKILVDMTVFSFRGAVRLARLLWEQEVVGSNPIAPTEHYGENLHGHRDTDTRS